MLKNSLYTKGFTLVELSIVLVIIGLIIGGILVGQDLITAASRRYVIKELDSYTAAANAFRLKFGCIPGDCNNATDFGLGTAGGPGDNGDKDGAVNCSDFISMFGGSWTLQKESMNFWYHLAQANLVKASTQGYTGAQPTTLVGSVPQLTLTGKVYVFAYSIINMVDPVAHFQLGNTFYLSGDIVSNSFTNSMNASEAYYFDSKMDDGRPFTGNIKLFRPAAIPAVTNPDVANPGVYGCAITNDYDILGNYQYDPGGSLIVESPRKPNATDCGLAIGKAW